MLGPTLLSLLLIRPKADLDLNSRNRMDSVSLPERSCAAFRHAEMLEMAFVLQFNKSLDRILKGNIGGDSSHLEEIHLLDAAELLVDERDTASEVLRTDQDVRRGKLRT